MHTIDVPSYIYVTIYKLLMKWGIQEIMKETYVDVGSASAGVKICLANLAKDQNFL